MTTNQRSLVLAALCLSITFPGFAQYGVKVKPLFRTIIVTDPLDWGTNKGSLGIQLHPQNGWGKFLNVGVNGFYGSVSMATESFETITKNSSTAYIEVQVRFFPWGARNNFKRNPVLQGCYSFSSEPSTDPLAGLYLEVSHAWEENKIQYDLPPDYPSPQSSYNYLIKSNAISTQIGYQFHLWHLTFGAAYRVSVSKDRALGNNLFPLTIRPVHNLKHGVKLEVGINFH